MAVTVVIVSSFVLDIWKDIYLLGDVCIREYYQKLLFHRSFRVNWPHCERAFYHNLTCKHLKYLVYLRNTVNSKIVL